MTNITIDEIKEAACGVDEDGNPKSIVIIGLQKFNVNDTTEDPETLMEISTVDAVVDIKSIGTFSYISLRYPDATNADLALAYRCLEQYYEKAEEESNDEYEVVAFISIIPLELTGEYIISALYPVFWALEPDIITEPARTLRVVHIPEDIQFMHSDLNDEDVARIIAEATNEGLDDVEALYSEEQLLAAESFDESLEERNRAFTDDKYDPSNAFNVFTDDEDYDDKDDE